MNQAKGSQKTLILSELFQKCSADWGASIGELGRPGLTFDTAKDLPQLGPKRGPDRGTCVNTLLRQLSATGRAAQTAQQRPVTERRQGFLADCRMGRRPHGFGMSVPAPASGRWSC